MTFKEHLFQVALGFDQLLNAIFGGYCDESLSSRSHRARMKGKRVWVAMLINAIFFWQADHCREAYESEINNEHLPLEMRDL